jgi:hypothetical protein
MRKTFFLIITILILFIASFGQAQVQYSAVTLSHLNLRAGPGVKYAILARLQAQATIIVEGRNNVGDWAFIRTADGANTGWVAMGFIQFDEAIRIMEQLPPISVTINNAGNGSNVIATAPTPVIIESIREFPTVVLNLNNARVIYNRGLARGRNPSLFMKVGESNLAGSVFLCNFQWGNYDLGEYEYLESIISYFNQSGSFCRYNVSAEPGFSAISLFDPTFSPKAACDPNETPLDCEIRRSQAMYAFVYIGIGDHMFSTAEAFRANYLRLVRTLKNNGVIPILASYPMADYFNDEGTAPVFNTIIRQVASAERVPLIDVRAAAYNYSNRGTGSDGYHLSVADGAFTSFAGDQDHFGRVLYEFHAMQVLYQLHTTFNP